MKYACIYIVRSIAANDGFGGLMAYTTASTHLGVYASRHIRNGAKAALITNIQEGLHAVQGGACCAALRGSGGPDGVIGTCA